MKTYLNLMLTLIILSVATLAQAQKDHKRKYQEFHLKDAELIYSGYSYTVEKIRENRYVYKMYNPDTRVNSHMITYKDGDLSIKHGPSKEIYDDGTIVEEGMYARNKKHGAWTENHNIKGFYLKGNKVGDWVRYNQNLDTMSITKYVQGKPHGVSSYFKEDGTLLYTNTHNMGEQISSTRTDSIKIYTESRPRFPGCEDMELEGNALTNCSNGKLKKYIQEEIRYPKSARNKGVEGRAIYSFMVDKDGSIINIKSLRGISEDINKECLRILNKMPKWIPGIQNGKPVKVKYTLPIGFKLPKK